MAYAPLNIGPYQGRAIRLGSSRSLKVYRGVRELGSSDPVLIIHDEFNGSGNADGRTPDTIDNGQTWESGAITNLVTGGYLYADNVSAGQNYTVINPLASSYRVESVCQGELGFRHGIYTSWTDTNNWERIMFNDTSTLLHQRRLAGTVTNTTIDTFSAVAENTDILWEVECSPSSLKWTITQSGSTVSSGSHPPYYTPGKCGWWSRFPDVAKCLNFKVYTPPVQANRVPLIGSVTQWATGSSPTILSSLGYWTAETFGIGMTQFNIRDDSYGFFMHFDTQTNRNNFYSAHGSTRDVVVVHPGGEYYWTNVSGMSLFGGIYVYCPATGLSGTLPSSSDPATIYLV